MAHAGFYTVIESLESCFGSLLSSMRMTCPTQQSRLFRIMGSMPVDSAMSKTCVCMCEREREREREREGGRENSL